MRRSSILLACGLVLLSVLLILYRVIWLGYPILPVAPGEAWELFIDAHISPGKEGGMLSLALPLEHTGKMVVEEHVVSGSYSFNITRNDHNRVGVWSGGDMAEPEEITYRATILYRPRRVMVNQSPLLSHYRSSTSGSERKILEELTASWRELSPVARLNAVASTLSGHGKLSLLNESISHKLQALLNNRERVDLVLDLLTAADLPARTVEGVRLVEGVQKKPIRWIEVWTGKTWSNLDPETGEISSLSAPLLPLAVGDLPAVQVQDAELSEIRWIMSRQPVSKWKLHSERIVRSNYVLDRWSLFQLPPDYQRTFRILLLVPIGALMISLLRNIIGVPTFGVFMPVLMALAFRNTGLVYGMAIFGGVLFIGLAARIFLDKFHLLLVPRLSVILTLVIASFTFLALLGHKLGLNELMAVGLIPFVILTMTIERFFVVIEESGIKEALLMTSGSTLVSIFTYWMISWDPMQLTFFVYPELILVVAALQILLGRYTGYRLTELVRFHNIRGVT